jgi:hypothetical protein
MPSGWLVQEGHPESDELEAYFLGTSSDPNLERVEEHLLICEPCQDESTMQKGVITFDNGRFPTSGEAARMDRRPHSTRAAAWEREALPLSLLKGVAHRTPDVGADSAAAVV